MKSVLNFLFTAITLSFLVSRALAADVAYIFTPFDLTVPGHPNVIAFPVDVNDKGSILTNIRSVDSLTEAAVVDNPLAKRRKQNKAVEPFTISCSELPFIDTAGESLNNRGQVAGSCSLTGSKEFGFIANPDGSKILFDFPGSDGTMARAISTDGKLAGQFFGPLRNDHGGALSYRFHCWQWDVRRGFRQIDFNVENTFVDCISINNRGQVLGRYITVDLENTTLKSGWFTYDNGNIDANFPEDFTHIGGPGFYFADMNEDGMMIGVHYNLPGQDRIVLFDDKFFDITGMPEDWLSVDVNGMNREAEFVGVFTRLKTPCPVTPSFPGCDVFETRGFFAKPAPIKAAKAK